jgi:hypothetical protein
MTLNGCLENFSRHGRHRFQMHAIPEMLNPVVLQVMLVIHICATVDPKEICAGGLPRRAGRPIRARGAAGPATGAAGSGGRDRQGGVQRPLVFPIRRCAGRDTPTPGVLPRQAPCGYPPR